MRLQLSPHSLLAQRRCLRRPDRRCWKICCRSFNGTDTINAIQRRALCAAISSDFCGRSADALIIADAGRCHSPVRQFQPLASPTLPRKVDAYGPKCF